MKNKKYNNKPVEYIFKCPKCGKNVLEEVMTNVTQSSSITTLIDEKGNLYLDYDAVSNDGGEIDRYQCADCGYVLTDKYGNTVKDTDSLMKWLKEHQK